MDPDGRVDRAAGIARTAVAALAVAVALLLVFKVQVVAVFRGALILLAALEVLAFGRHALSAGAGRSAWLEIGVKLAVLAVAYSVLSG